VIDLSLPNINKPYVHDGTVARHFWGPHIRAGDVVRWPYLNAPTAPTDERDLAAVAVRALCEDGHAGAEYILTGPQSLTHAEQLHTIGRAIGRSLRVEEMSPDEARSELLPILGSPTVVNMLLNAWAAAIGQPAFVTSSFAELTGAPPRTFLEWATDHAAEFRPLDGDSQARVCRVTSRQGFTQRPCPSVSGPVVGAPGGRTSSSPA